MPSGGSLVKTAPICEVHLSHWLVGLPKPVSDKEYIFQIFIVSVTKLVFQCIIFNSIAFANLSFILKILSPASLRSYLKEEGVS